MGLDMLQCPFYKMPSTTVGLWRDEDTTPLLKDLPAQHDGPFLESQLHEMLSQEEFKCEASLSHLVILCSKIKIKRAGAVPRWKCTPRFNHQYKEKHLSFHSVISQSPRDAFRSHMFQKACLKQTNAEVVLFTCPFSSPDRVHTG